MDRSGKEVVIHLDDSARFRVKAALEVAQVESDQFPPDFLAEGQVFSEEKALLHNRSDAN